MPSSAARSAIFESQVPNTITLADLPINQRMTITKGDAVIVTTPRELVENVHMPAGMTLAQVMFAFAIDEHIPENVVPIWHKRMPRG